MTREDFPAPDHGFVITHFLVVSDMDRSREFYVELLGGGIASIDFRLVTPGSGLFDGESFSFELSSTSFQCMGPPSCAMPPSPTTLLSPVALVVTLGDLGIPGGARAFFFAAGNGPGIFQATARETSWRGPARRRVAGGRGARPA